MLRVYMSEKMQSGLNSCYAGEKLSRTIVDIVVKVEDAKRRCVGDENIRTFRNICIMFGLTVSNAWKSHATLTLLAKQDLPTFGYNMIDPLKSWCWGSILFYPFKISRFS